MDRDAYAAANALAGNTAGEAVLEHTIYGGSYLFESDETAVLTGADMKPALDGRPVPMYRPFSVKAGQVLSLGMAENGCRTCLALAGGIDVPVVLGSRSTSIKCSLGGLEGRALKAGDRIPVGASSVPEAELLNRSLPPAVYESQVTVRVIPGPQEEAFTEMALKPSILPPTPLLLTVTGWDTGWMGRKLKVSGEPTLSLTPLSLAPYRFPPPESRLSFCRPADYRRLCQNRNCFFPGPARAGAVPPRRYGKIFPNFCRRGPGTVSSERRHL